MIRITSGLALALCLSGITQAAPVVGPRHTELRREADDLRLEHPSSTALAQCGRGYGGYGGYGYGQRPYGPVYSTGYRGGGYGHGYPRGGNYRHSNYYRGPQRGGRRPHGRHGYGHGGGYNHYPVNYGGGQFGLYIGF